MKVYMKWDMLNMKWKSTNITPIKTVKNSGKSVMKKTIPNTTQQLGRCSMPKNISWETNGKLWMIKLISSKTRLEQLDTDIINTNTLMTKLINVWLMWTLTTRKFMSWDNKKKTSKRDGLRFSIRLQEVLNKEFNSQMRPSLMLDFLLLPSLVLSSEPLSSLCRNRDPPAKLTTNFHLSKNEPRNWSNEIEKFELIYNQKIKN